MLCESAEISIGRLRFHLSSTWMSRNPSGKIDTASCSIGIPDAGWLSQPPSPQDAKIKGELRER